MRHFITLVQSAPSSWIHDLDAGDARVVRLTTVGHRAGFILVADDDLDVREALTELLRDAGYTVVAVRDGQEALEVMAATLPCMVLLDLTMPIVSGWSVFSAMQQISTMKAIPVCVLSAVAKEAPAGVACVLSKPVNVKLLLETVATYC